MSEINPVSIHDLRCLARKRLPAVLYDYIEGGAEDEITLLRNRSAFSEYRFVPRVLRNVADVDLSTTIGGIPVSMPLICAPTAMTGLFHHHGELGMAKATAQAGIPYVLSTVANTTLEQIQADGNRACLFQIYIWRDRDIVFRLLDRCHQAGYKGIMLAVDMAAFGKRERDLRNGHGNPRLLRFNVTRSALRRPAWLYHYLRSPTLRIANMADILPDNGRAMTTIDTVNSQFDPSITWEDVEDIRRHWAGVFYLKGIQSVEDAILAKQHGVTGIVISNHGGRQLDGAPATFNILPEIVKAVGGSMEILLDGGISRGSDVIKALALGADACLVGRAPLYGLAAMGENGARHALEILRDEMERVMRLIGVSSLSELGPHSVVPEPKSGLGKDSNR